MPFIHPLDRKLKKRQGALYNKLLDLIKHMYTDRTYSTSCTWYKQVR